VICEGMSVNEGEGGGVRVHCVASVLFFIDRRLKQDPPLYVYHRITHQGIAYALWLGMSVNEGGEGRVR